MRWRRAAAAPSARAGRATACAACCATQATRASACRRAPQPCECGPAACWMLGSGSLGRQAVLLSTPCLGGEHWQGLLAACLPHLQSYAPAAPRVQCESTSEGTGAYVDASGACQPCPSGCLLCQNGEGQCEEAGSGYRLVSDSAKPSPCPDNCQECDSEGACGTCADGWSLDGSGACVQVRPLAGTMRVVVAQHAGGAGGLAFGQPTTCQLHTAEAPARAPPTLLPQCDANCLSCAVEASSGDETPATKCVRCADGWGPVSSGRCQACSSPACTSCPEGPAECAECREGFVAYGGGCTKCGVSGCVRCDPSDPQRCTKCSEGRGADASGTCVEVRQRSGGSALPAAAISGSQRTRSPSPP